VFLAEQCFNDELTDCTTALDRSAVAQMLRSAEVQAQIDPSYAGGIAQVAGLLARLEVQQSPSAAQ
jgi:hypothetical protein